MRATMSKKFLIIFALFIFCSFLISCSLTESHPEYLIESASDNGFVPSYRAYFAIKDNSIAKTSKAKYEHYIYEDKDNVYKTVSQKFYSFEVNAETEDPVAWEYEPDYSGDGVYDTDILIQRLQTMEICFKGQVDIEITEFDDYDLISVANMDKDNTVIDLKYAVFHSNKKLSMQENLNLNSIRNIYKFCQK